MVCQCRLLITTTGGVPILIDFSKIPRDKYGNILPPKLVLKTRYDKVLGVLGRYFGLELSLKFNEVSEGSFSIPAYVEGEATPFYKRVLNGSLIQIDPYGIFIVSETEIENDGVAEIKHVTLRSREYEFESKKLVFPAGTYNFYNPVDNTDTIVGMLLEKLRNWKVGYVDPALWNKYRTFGDTNTGALSFACGEAQTTYECVFVFDTYDKTFDVLDATVDRSVLPIYISTRNLIETIEVNESDDNMATVLSVYGADPISIRDVNPIGTAEIYNLGYYISLGELPADVEAKYKTWKSDIAAAQANFSNLVSLRGASSGRYIAESARLTDMENELSTNENLRTTYTQALASAKTSEGKALAQTRLDELVAERKKIQAKIATQKEKLEAIQAEYDGYVSAIADIVNTLKVSAYFTAEELEILDPYFVEQDFSDSSFAVFDVDIDATGDSYSNLSAATLSFANVTINNTTVAGSDHHIFDIKGGTVAISDGEYSLAGDIIRATLDKFDDDNLVLSVYLGATVIGEDKFSGGTLTCVGITADDIDSLLANMNVHSDTIKDAETGVSHSVEYYTGDMSISITDAASYVTRTASEYQQAAVAQELYDYATSQLEKIAYPTYTFDVKSGNLVWDSTFKPFNDKLQLGSALYLQISDDVRLTPLLLEVQLDFEERSLELIYSNEFQRNDAVRSLKDIISESASTNRSFDMSKFQYGKGSSAYSAVSNFLQQGLDAAHSIVTAGRDNSVTIGPSGVVVTTDGSDERIVISDGMIALVNDADDTSRMAMGHFYNEATQTDYYGILADVIGGKMVVGENLFMECVREDGEISKFIFDSQGAQLYNSIMYIQSQYGGHIGLDGNYGIFMGGNQVFETDGNGFIHPTFIDESGAVVYDDEGFPENVNFWADINGDIWLRGKVYATDGEFVGDVTARNFYFQDGDDIKTLLNQAEKSFDLSDLDYIDLGGIVLDGRTGNISFEGAGSITWGNVAPVRYQFSVDGTGNWHETMTASDKFRRDSLDGGTTWGDPYQFRGVDGENGSDASVPSYITRSGITETYIESPKLRGNDIYALKAFKVGEEDNVWGFMGPAQGSTLVWNEDGSTSETTTYGVALASKSVTTSEDTGGYVMVDRTTTYPYFIVADSGARMQAGDYSVFVTSNGAYWSDGVEVYRIGSTDGAARFG